MLSHSRMLKMNYLCPDSSSGICSKEKMVEELDKISTSAGDVVVRKTFSYREHIYRDGQREARFRVSRAVVGAVLINPYADVYDESLQILRETGGIFGRWASQQAKDLLHGNVRAYGKGGIVGERGELEHIAALLHPEFGGPTREALGGISLLPSVKKRGGTGCSIDIPVHHVKAMRVRDFFDSVSVCIPDAPLGNEILIALAACDGPRPAARMGGLAESELVGIDGVN